MQNNFQMEALEPRNNLSKSVVQRRQISSATFKDQKENLMKKRPSTTKLDLEKIFQESIELTRIHKKLFQENKHLKSEHQKVQIIKTNRQNLISMVEKLVQQKAKELKNNPSNQSSWLVHKLNGKIYQLKMKIQNKEKTIKELQLSKESQLIRQKQTEIQCLDEILRNISEEKYIDEKAEYEEADYYDGHDASERNSILMNGIKEIVWMEEQIKEKQEQILQAEKIYEQEDRQSKKLMMEIAKRKAELKEIKEIENDYHKAQDQLKEEKKKKEQRLAGNKTYLDQLIQARHIQLRKLDQLKAKFTVIETEQNQAVIDLENKLQQLKKDYETKSKQRQSMSVKTTQQKAIIKQQKWVKRVQYNQVRTIARNLNYDLALKKVDKTQVLNEIFQKGQKKFSIQEMIEILQSYPFNIKCEKQRQLVARYCIQDSGDGFFLQDMNTSESRAIIKSVLSKLIGQTKIYTEQEAQANLAKVGDIMSKFHSLVQQNIDQKEGNKKKANKQAVEDAIVSIEQDLDKDEINFIILYLYSWSQNIESLDLSLLKNMQQKDVKWFSPKVPSVNHNQSNSNIPNIQTLSGKKIQSEQQPMKQSPEKQETYEQEYTQEHIKQDNQPEKSA